MHDGHGRKMRGVEGGGHGGDGWIHVGGGARQMKEVGDECGLCTGGCLDTYIA